MSLLDVADLFSGKHGLEGSVYRLLIAVADLDGSPELYLHLHIRVIAWSCSGTDLACRVMRPY